jgi:hypothetical protein
VLLVLRSYHQGTDICVSTMGKVIPFIIWRGPSLCEIQVVQYKNINKVSCKSHPHCFTFIPTRKPVRNYARCSGIHPSHNATALYISQPTARHMFFKEIRQILTHVGTSHMSDNRQMSISRKWLVELISMVTNSMLLHNNTGANITLLCNNTTTERNCNFCWVHPNIATTGSNRWRKS